MSDPQADPQAANPPPLSSPRLVRRRKTRIPWATVALLRASRLTWSEIAKQIGMGTPLSLRVGFIQQGLSAQLAKQSAQVTQDYTRAAVASAHRQIDKIGESVRSQLGGALERNATALASQPAARTIVGVKQFGDALEPLVRSAKTIFDWGTRIEGGIIAMDCLGTEDAEEAPAIDVAEVPPEPVKVPEPTSESEAALAALLSGD
jgi:hypothetical protein